MRKTRHPGWEFKSWGRMGGRWRHAVSDVQVVWRRGGKWAVWWSAQRGAESKPDAYGIKQEVLFNSTSDAVRFVETVLNMNAR